MEHERKSTWYKDAGAEAVPSLDHRATDDAVSEVHAEHWLTVHRMARRLCGDDLAAEVTQEVFLRFWRDPDRFDPTKCTVRQYLLTMTRTAALDCLRQRATRQRNQIRANSIDPLAASARPADASSTSDRVSSTDTKNRVLEAVHALPEAERDVITAAFFLHLSYRQVAAGLGIPEATAKSRMRSGLSRLRQQLGSTEVYTLA